MNPLPRFIHVRQNFAPTAPVEIRSTVHAQFGPLCARLKPGMRIAVGVGSRGITNLPGIVKAVLDEICVAGAEPFIIPAMGSHGGATPEGQTETLAGYGITAEAFGVPIRASMEVREIGRSADGVPVYCGTDALDADGIVLVNRVKPHTDFVGALGSGLLKMSVIGLGKRAGAAAMHVEASRLGHERVIRNMARVMIAAAPVLGGLAILENQFHETARLQVLLREEMETGEDVLLREARALMPLLPFTEIDLLIVDRIGKNLSGTGMDPNVINRSVYGYVGTLMREERPAPFIRRIFVRDLSEESHGNAIGIGLADITTARLVRAMDHRSTYINSLTALTPQSAKIPIHFEADREAIDLVLNSLALADTRAARIVRIADTLSLTRMEISEPLWHEVQGRPGLTAEGKPHEAEFNAAGLLV